MRYPELNVPFARFEQRDGLTVFMQANVGRHFALTGEQANYSFAPIYGQYGLGLVLRVIGAEDTVDLNGVKAGTEKLLSAYHVPSNDRIDRESFERFILDFYALVPYRMGQQYEDARLYADARIWYRRSLGIQPELPEAIAGLNRVERK
jgi:hypothetical protein